MSDKPEQEVLFSNEMDYPEVAALFEICGLIPDYPRDFRKGESPDWINGDIGLEVTKAVSDDVFQELRVMLGNPETLDELTRVPYKYDTLVLCRIDSGEFAGKEFYYSLHDRAISYPEKPKVLYFDNLTEKERDAIASSKPLIYMRSNELDDPSEPYRLALAGLRIKLGKLQGYKVRKYNHLAVISGGFAGEQFPDMFLEMFIEENEKWERKFDKLYLSVLGGLYVFDLVARKHEYIPKVLRSFDMYRDNIHDPPVPERYLFEDVVREVPDLRPHR